MVGHVLLYIVWLRAGRLGDRGSIPDRGERIFPLTSVSRPALGPTQPPVQWVPRVLSPGVKRCRGVTLTTHPHLVPGSRVSRSYTPLPPSVFMVCSGTALALHVVLKNTDRWQARLQLQYSVAIDTKVNACGIHSYHWSINY
jgi:hypothetical protein